MLLHLFEKIVRNSVFSKATELPGLIASVDEVIYMDGLEAPPDRPYSFVYFITITNKSKVPVTIKGRKWIIESSNKEKLVVEGDGVVGQFPRLKPGEEFHYNSYHIVAVDSVAHGSFLGVTDAGEPVVTRIPRFEMQVP
jgi:ApaG protein